MKLICKSILILLLALAPIALFCQVSPNGGENGEYWTQGDNVTIKWDTMYFHGAVDIYIWNMNDCTLNRIDSGVTASTGIYAWSIPSNHAFGNYFRIKIEQSDSAEIYAMSSTYFPIYENTGGIKLSDDGIVTVNENRIGIVPNPAGNNVHVSWNYALPVHLVYMADMNGREIKKYNTEATRKSLDINTSDLNNGNYFIVVYFSDGSRSVGKLIISK